MLRPRTAPAGAAGSLSGTKNLAIDTMPPDTSITDSPSAQTSTTAAVFTFSSTKPSGASYEVNLDGAGFVPHGSATTITYAGLAEGAHTFQVRALDSATPSNVDATPAQDSWTSAAAAAAAPADSSGNSGGCGLLGPEAAGLGGLAALLRRRAAP